MTGATVAAVNIFLWVTQVILAIAFIGAGYTHALQRDRPRPGMEWMQAVPAPLLTAIGVLEILGGIGLVLPAATGILPVLTPIAAACFVVLMIFAAIFHLRRPGEARNAVFNVILGAIAAFVAYGRFVLEPFA